MNDGKKQEILYDKVDNFDLIKKIEVMSERWTIDNSDLIEKIEFMSEQLAKFLCSGDYIILEQHDITGKSTGYIKIVEKSKISLRRKVNWKDWKYYKRRLPANEIRRY